MAEEKKDKSSLGDRMNDFHFVIKDASGKPKGTISSSSESKPKDGDDKASKA